MQQNGELSVEEILESIKKVIARDNKETAQADRYRRETEGVVFRGPVASLNIPPLAENGNDDDLDDDDDDNEVLDLSEAATEMLDEEADSLEDETVEADNVTDLPFPIEDSSKAEAAPLPPAPLELQTPVEQFAAPAARPSLEALPTMTDTPAPTADIPTQENEAPLERMVRESLRPMLREWLDANLEPMVERMVKSELERIIGKPS